MKRNKHNLSHYKLLTCDMGQLIPCGLVEVLPGDSFQHNTTALVRVSPLLAPVMHTVHCSISHWYVPHRLVWDEWEDFITAGPSGTSTPTFPTRAASGTIGGLSDYLGFPTIAGSLVGSALPFRGYAMIWNEYFRDQDLETELAISKASGTDATTSTSLQRVAWEKDYFTTARPWEQKGPSITIPIGSTAPVKGLGVNDSGSASQLTSITLRETGGTQAITNLFSSGVGADIVMKSNGSNQPQVFTDLTGASAVTITALREAFALQRFEEARARFGSRYTEYLRYLGVTPSDARLQRPEFLGGGRYPLQFSEVLQTAEGTDPVGELRGHGIGVARSSRYRRFFEEHGYVYTLMHIRPKTLYMQGLNRTFNRRTKEDFWQKELEAIGQQEVLNKEVYGPHTTPDGIFGYANRYQEYREQPSSISGEFRTVLDFWHFGRQFTSDPALNASFIQCNPSEEPFAVPSQHTMYVMAKHRLAARRLVSRSSKSYIY